MEREEVPSPSFKINTKRLLHAPARQRKSQSKLNGATRKMDVERQEPGWAAINGC